MRDVLKTSLRSLLLRVIIPISLFGILISSSLSYFLVPPLTSIIEQRADKEISHTNFLATNICEERFSDILDLRMEEDVAMNKYLKKEALEEIKEVASIFPEVKTLVIDNTGTVQGASFPLQYFKTGNQADILQQLVDLESGSGVIQLQGDPIRVSHEYFPFWRWHIISFISLKEYLAPIVLTKKILYIGTFGTLFAVIVTVILVFFYQINRPLRRIILATEQVRQGNFQQVGLRGHGEIERVGVAFDEMVQNLEADKNRIEMILKDLGDSEKLYRALFEQAAVGVAISDSRTGSFIQVNGKYAETVGYPVEKLNQIGFQEISHPSDLQADLEKMDLLVAGKITEYTLDKRFIHKDGSVVWGRITVSPMWKPGDQPGFHIAILEDITRRKQIEDELLSSESRYRDIFNNLIDIYTEVDPEGNIIEVSPSVERYTGYTREEILGNPAEKYYANPQKRAEMLEELFTKGSIHDFEIEMIHKNGQLVPFSITSRLQKDAQGNFEKLIGMTRYIADRKNAELALSKSEERYRLVMEACPEPLVVYDMQGRAQYLNLAFTRVFGWTSSELLGKKIPFVPQEAWPETAKMLELVKKGENYFGFETRRLDKSGKVIDVVLSWGVWRDPDGSLAGTVVVLRDVSKKRMLKKQLLQAQKMESIGNLAGGIAHDFNNILSPIVGYSQLLKINLPQDGLNHQYANSILTAGLRASELVSQILAFSRQSDQEKVQVEVQTILQEVLRLSRSIIPTSIEIVQDIQSDCRSVEADPTQLHQVAMNLVTNAYHAVDESSGKISLSLKEVVLEDVEILESPLGPGAYAMLSVSDNGTGIPAEVMERIFDPYFTTKGKSKGTGLGLAIVYGIIKEHSGDIKVYSEPGKGTTFTVYLPIVTEPRGVDQQEPREDLQLGTEHILLVDDEKSVADIGREMLEKLGYKVSVFTNSISALEAYKNNAEDFDLVITDMTMPDLTGTELAKKILAIKADIPIIMCTGLDTQVSKVKVEAMGIKWFMRKPLFIEELASAIRGVLGDGKD